MSASYAETHASRRSGKPVPSSLETLPQRLGYALEKLGEAESVQVTGKSWKQLHRYAAGAEPPMSVVVALCEASGLQLDWMIYRRETAAISTISGLPDEFALLPRYSVQASAGNGLVPAEEVEVERIAFRLDWLREMGLDPNQAGLLTAQGDSMYPTIPDGALILVDRRPDQAIRSGFVYVIVLGGEVLVKRVSRNVDGTIDLISDNPIYPVQKIKQTEFDQLLIAGRVFWIGRKL